MIIDFVSYENCYDIYLRAAPMDSIREGEVRALKHALFFH